jgi:hypothetical protein
MDAIVMGSVDALAAKLAIAICAALANALIVLEAQVALGSVRGDGDPKVVGRACVSDIETGKQLRALRRRWQSVILVQINDSSWGSHG